MELFRTEWFQAVQEVCGEHESLQIHSLKALRNMLAYCRARVVQLDTQEQFLKFVSRQQYDLHDLFKTWRRLERTEKNHRRFIQRCILLQIELARREESLENQISIRRLS